MPPTPPHQGLLPPSSPSCPWTGFSPPMSLLQSQWGTFPGGSLGLPWRSGWTCLRVPGAVSFPALPRAGTSSRCIPSFGQGFPTSASLRVSGPLLVSNVFCGHSPKTSPESSHSHAVLPIFLLLTYDSLCLCLFGFVTSPRLSFSFSFSFLMPASKAYGSFRARD